MTGQYLNPMLHLLYYHVLSFQMKQFPDPCITLSSTVMGKFICLFINITQALSGDFQHARINAISHAMVCDNCNFFIQFHNFIKGIVHIYKVYELAQMFIPFSRTGVSLFNQVNEKVYKKNCPNVLYTCIKFEESQTYHFFIHS